MRSLASEHELPEQVSGGVRIRIYKALGLGRHVVLALCLLLALAATTNAYSIIMHGGKRVEIPAQFNVTKTTITYEAAPGFWKTMQMAALSAHLNYPGSGSGEPSTVGTRGLLGLTAVFLFSAGIEGGNSSLFRLPPGTTDHH